MAGKLPIRVEYDRSIRKPLAMQSAARGQDGANARIVSQLTGCFVDLFEMERARETHPPHFVHAVIAANANTLAGLTRYCIDSGQQRRTLQVFLDILRTQITPRLDVVDTAIPVFFPGFDPSADRRERDEAVKAGRAQHREEHAGDE